VSYKGQMITEFVTQVKHTLDVDIAGLALGFDFWHRPAYLGKLSELQSQNDRSVEELFRP